MDRSIGLLCFALLCGTSPPPQHTVVSTLSGPVPHSLSSSAAECAVCAHSGRCTLHATSVSLAIDRLCDGVLTHQECRAGPLRREARACRPCLQTIRCGMTAMHWWRTTWCSASQRSCGSTIPCAHLWAADGARNAASIVLRSMQSVSERSVAAKRIGSSTTLSRTHISLRKRVLIIALAY